MSLASRFILEVGSQTSKAKARRILNFPGEEVSILEAGRIILPSNCIALEDCCRHLVLSSPNSLVDLFYLFMVLDIV